MQRFLPIVFAWTVLPFAHATADAVDQAIKEGLPTNSIVWQNGLFQMMIDLSADATAEQITAEVAKIENRAGTNEAFKGYQIVQSKPVMLDEPKPYTAIVIVSARGSQSLIIAKYFDVNAPGVKVNSDPRLPKPKSYWWHRTFYTTTVP